MKNNKIHIDIRDNIDHETAIKRVLKVVQDGRVSSDNTEYCWLTTWTDNIAVSVRDYRKSDCFIVYKQNK